MDDDSFDVHWLGSVIKELRTAKGLSQEALASQGRMAVRLGLLKQKKFQMKTKLTDIKEFRLRS